MWCYTVFQCSFISLVNKVKRKLTELNVYIQAFVYQCAYLSTNYSKYDQIYMNISKMYGTGLTSQDLSLFGCYATEI